MHDSIADLSLSPSERQQWQDHGYFIRHQQFAQTELLQLRRAAAKAAARAEGGARLGHTYFLDDKRFVDVEDATIQYEHAPGSTTLRVLEPVHLFHEQIDRLVDDPRLAQPMRELVGADSLSLWTAKLNMKSAAGSGFGWHQDSPYWIHDCAHVDQLPNVMLALDAQSPANGCLRIIRGSHKLGILPGTADGTQLGGFYTDPAAYSLEDEEAMHVEAGALIFLHSLSVHGSQPNTSEHSRRALIFTYLPGDFPMLKNGEVRNVQI